MGHKGIDRRDSERHRVRTTLWIKGLRGGEHKPLAVTDVSEDGLAFRSDIRWYEGDPVWISVNVDRAMEIDATVVRCKERSQRLGSVTRALSGQIYDVAVSFVDATPGFRREVIGQIFRTEVYARGKLA